MRRELRKTADGSSTFFVEELDEHYHSIHGALQESKHVFIDAGLKYFTKEHISVLEVGLGTALNALLTAVYAQENNKAIFYKSLEKYPLNADEIAMLNYKEISDSSIQADLFEAIHSATWGSEQAINSHFSIFKQQVDLKDFREENSFDIIYFDAFAPSAQPNLWETPIFEAMFNALKPSGILVTYCAKGQVKRNMKAAGFTIEALPGPPGKREMTRALKI